MDFITTFLGLSGKRQQGTFPLAPLKFPAPSAGSILSDSLVQNTTIDESLLVLLQQRNPENVPVLSVVPSQSAACAVPISSLYLSALEIQQIDLGTGTGFVSLVYNTTQPIAIQVAWDQHLELDTQFRGDLSQNPELYALTGQTVSGPGNGILSFYKNKTTQYASVSVWDPFKTGDWTYYLTCVTSTPIIPSPEPSLSPECPSPSHSSSASHSASISHSHSVSTAPSSSPSLAPSVSHSPSTSTAPSASPSVSTAPSVSHSASISIAPSISHSPSASPSPSP